MTVTQLIAHLAELDGDLPVIMPSERYDFCAVASVAVDHAAESKEGMELAYPGEAGAMRAARLFGPEGSEQ
jgi:hypothetical protein